MYNPARLPTEIWEKVLDFVAGLSLPDGDLSAISRCSLVCRSWLPRCRFHLCGRSIYLRSGRAPVSFSLFLSSSPQLSTRVTQISVSCGRRSKAITKDSWVSTVPLVLPTLPSLRSLIIRDVDLTRQHPSFYTAHAKYKFVSNVTRLSLEDVSFANFAQLARLALVMHIQSLTLRNCTLSSSAAPAMSIDKAPPVNPWLKSLILLSPLPEAPWNWILACPHLSELTLRFTNDDTSESGLAAPEPFASHLSSARPRICGIFQRLRARAVSTVGRGAAMYIRFDGRALVHMADSKDITTQQSVLRISGVGTRRSDLVPATFIAAVSAMLPLLTSCEFTDIIIEIHRLGWNWEEHTPEKWKAIDAALGQHNYPALRVFDLQLRAPLPRRDVFMPEYGCVDSFTRALFPRAAARGLLVNKCDGARCSRHSRRLNPPQLALRA